MYYEKNIRDKCMLYNTGQNIPLSEFFDGDTDTLTVRGPLYLDQKCVTVGKNCFINFCFTVLAAPNPECYVQIGNNVGISSSVTLITVDHPANPLSLPEWKDIPKPITIEDNVWIGANATILGGIKIGEGAIIGAGSVVTKDVLPYAIAKGNPARMSKKGSMINYKSNYNA